MLDVFYRGVLNHNLLIIHDICSKQRMQNIELVKWQNKTGLVSRGLGLQQIFLDPCLDDSTILASKACAELVKCIYRKAVVPWNQESYKSL